MFLPEVIGCKDADPVLFYPDTSGAAVDLAKAICHACPVELACFEEALRIDAWGVWGGTTRRERRKMQKAAARG